MKKLFLLNLLMIFCCTSLFAARPKQQHCQLVKPGIEVLAEDGFAPLKGKRVGLVTNPSGVDRNLVSTIDILFNAPEVNLVALFGPEHGVRGDVYAGGKIKDSVDPVTGLPVYSLYGSTHTENIPEDPSQGQRCPLSFHLHTHLHAHRVPVRTGPRD